MTTTTEELKTKGSSLDTRLRHSMLLDAKLQRKLTAEEFRAWVNLNVWVVSLVSDGHFDPADAEMIANLDFAHIAKFHELGLIANVDHPVYRIDPDYWSWQTSRADLKRMEQQRDANRRRQVEFRERSNAAKRDEDPWQSDQ